MSKSTLKVVIPMAGFGTRLRPHTWSRPKQLIRMAGKTVLDHVLDSFSTLPNHDIEYIFIVGYLGEKIEEHMQKAHPGLKVKYVEQEEMRGQSHAIWLAREHLNGPMLMVFADTLVETDLSFLSQESAGAVAWVKPVPDPRRFGVAAVGKDGYVTRLFEKPDDDSNNLAVVGFYYFQDSKALIEAIEEQFRLKKALNKEYFLADAVNIMLERGLKMRTQQVETWLDAGTIEDVLITNRHLLEHGHDNSAEAAQRKDVVIFPPVYIHPDARVQGAVIGPFATIGADCQVTSCIIRNSILDDGAIVSDVVMESSLIGQKAQINRRPAVINAGDHTELSL
ncbi:MAG: NTP transferase domain-containing protein [Anaerolineales bacterium]|nr:NTP transferase domain-containing protein [Anaerolineales bacterium]